MPRFGTFNPLSKIFLVLFRQTLVISETICRNFQDFLATGRLFAENLARILEGVKGIAWRAHPGGGSVFVLLPSLPACGLSCGPVPSEKNRASVHLHGLLWALGLLFRLGLLLYRLPAYLVKIGTKGENFQPKFLSLCTSFPVHHWKMTTDNRTQKKKRPFIWVVSRWVVWCFSLSIGTLQQGCPCGWLLGFVGRFCPRLFLWRSGLQYNINCFGRLLLSCFCSYNGLRVSLCLSSCGLWLFLLC